MGEYYEAGELGGTHIGGVEGGDKVRAMSEGAGDLGWFWIGRE